MEIKTLNYPSGELWYENHYDNNQVVHSIEYYKNGTKRTELFFENEKLHRTLHAGAVVKYYETGEVKEEIYYKEGKKIDNREYYKGEYEEIMEENDEFINASLEALRQYAEAEKYRETVANKTVTPEERKKIEGFNNER